MTEGRAGARLKMLAVLVAFMFCALTVRLWYLQVLASDTFSQQADDNFIRFVQTPATRGKILDDTGRNVLVDNRLSLDVTVSEDQLGANAEETLYRLSQLLRMPVGKITAALEDPRYYDYQPVPIAFDVKESVAAYIAEHPKQLQGVDYQRVPVRTYPQGELAAHILGYAGQITAEQLKSPAFKNYEQTDQVGQGGLEAEYERWLRGEKGVVKYRVDASGRNLGILGDAQEPVPGSNVVLNINSKLQRATENALVTGMEGARKVFDDNTNQFLKAGAGAAVVVEPDTGAIKAIASWPTYDPSLFIGGIDPAQYRKLNREPADQPLYNRAISGQYPPGSTFKPFTALSAVRSGIASLNGYYDCPASYVAPGDESGTEFANWSSTGLGYMHLDEALRVSCDTVFYPFGYDYWGKYVATADQKQPEEPFQRDLRQFGFGRSTGLDLAGEQPGFIPTAEWKEAVSEESPKVYGQFGWTPGDLIQMTIGQGDVLATPLQVATAYSSIANGGRLCQPRLAAEIVPAGGGKPKEIKSDCQKLPYDENDLQYVRNALAGVPVSGTAADAFAGFPLSRYPIAGKTGTAEVPPKQDFSWFAAMSPVNDPDYVVVAMVEEGGHGSTTAAPIVRNILESIYGLDQTGFVDGGQSD